MTAKSKKQTKSAATQPASPRPAPRLYLVTPPMAAPEALAAPLAAALQAADIAAVLLRLADVDERTLIKRVKAIAPSVQEAGAALLLDGHAAIVPHSGADGAHLSDVAALLDAMPRLHPDRMAGAGGLRSRHDAMIAGEVKADYVLFGEPDAHGERPSTQAIAERLGWWAELFEPPCVGYADTLEEVALYVAAGADFIMPGDFVWRDDNGIAARIAGIARIMAETFAQTAPQGNDSAPRSR